MFHECHCAGAVTVVYSERDSTVVYSERDSTVVYSGIPLMWKPWGTNWITGI